MLGHLLDSLAACRHRGFGRRAPPRAPRWAGRPPASAAPGARSLTAQLYSILSRRSASTGGRANHTRKQPHLRALVLEVRVAAEVPPQLDVLVLDLAAAPE